MASYDYDLFVIGAGSGGVRAARLAAMSGARVAVAEEDKVGGTCVIRGCVPKKFMVYASEFSRTFAEAEGYGWSKVDATFDWTRFLMAKDVEIGRLSGIYASNLAKAGAELIHAKARLADDHTVELVGKHKSVTAQTILIATGGRVSVPADLPGIEHVITSNEAFHLTRLPKSIMVCGGGYIAVEFAGIFNGLGVDTTLVYRGPNILRGFDEDVRAHVSEEIEKRGIKLIVGTQHERIDKTDKGLVSVLDNGVTLTTDQVMFATGRMPYVEGLGLDKAGVALNDKGAIAVGELGVTNVPSIYAIGDVTDRQNLTPVTIAEGHSLAEALYGSGPRAWDLDRVATAVFSIPPLATVGLTEAHAAKQGPVDIYISRFTPMRHTLTGRVRRTMMKLVVDQASQRVVGAHMIGEDAPEIMQGLSIAINAGATKGDFDRTVGIHPTAAEEFVTMRTRTRVAGMLADE